MFFIKQYSSMGGGGGFHGGEQRFSLSFRMYYIAQLSLVYVVLHRFCLCPVLLLTSLSVRVLQYALCKFL